MSTSYSTSYSTSLTTSVTSSVTTTSGGGGGCVLYNSTILTYNGPKKVSELKVGDLLVTFDPASNKTKIVRVTYISKSKVGMIMLINNKIGVTLNDQPLFVKNSTYTGWVMHPSALRVGWYLYEPIEKKWVKIENISYRYGEFEVYDIVTNGPNTFIVENVLADANLIK